MLRSPSTPQFDIDSGPKLNIDGDEADLTVLEENLKSTDQYCTDISRQLEQISARNGRSIQNMKPLMSRIGLLRVQQSNINDTAKLVGDVRNYASSIKKLNKASDPNQELNDMSQISQFSSVLSKYSGIRHDLEMRNLDGFNGIVKDLDKSIKNSEDRMKYELLGKLQELDKTQSGQMAHHSEADLINQIQYIYGYMKSERGIDYMDLIVRERTNHVLNTLKTEAPLQLPSPNGDRNFVYTQSKDERQSFGVYANTVRTLFDQEARTLKQMLPSSKESTAALISVTGPLLNDVSKEANTFAAFVANNNNKHHYGTILYEVSDGIDMLIQHLHGYKAIQIPRQLMQDSQKMSNLTRQIFQDFYEFANMRFREVVVGDHPKETLNNAFMTLMTHLNKLSYFREPQLKHIAGMENGSWLPSTRPRGFQPMAAKVTDPEYLLSSFYSDSIDYSYYSLLEKFRPHMSKADLGMMLLFNLHGLESLLGEKSNLSTVLGQPGMTRIAQLRKKAVDLATDDWNTLTQRLMMASTKQGESFNMRNKDMGKFIDEFNKTFDDNCNKFQTKNLSPFFKKQLAENIRKMLGPTYGVFYKSVSSDPSAKSVMKHFKYDSNSLEHKLLSLA